DAASEPRVDTRLHRRRRRGRDRGQRIDGAPVPKRDRPPPRCADVRSDDAGAAQRGDVRIPTVAGSAADRGPEASLEIAVTAAAPPRRLVFLGTPQMAVPALRALVDAGFDVALVVTRIDKRRGRGSELMPSPVKATALELGLPVSHSVDDVLAVGADLGVVVAFGQLIKPHVLDVMPMVNLHFSLLPRWRGAAPVERALLAGDSETGVCLMQLEEGLDTGPVYRVVVVPIGPTITADELRRELVDVGTSLLVDELRAG